MHAYFTCTFMYLRVSLLIYMHFNTRRYFMYVIRSLHVRLIADLHRGCELFHTSGKKWGNTWLWWATWKPISYTSWAAGEPNGNGNYLYAWNYTTPASSTWYDDVDKKKCFICEHHIKVPFYCKWKV